MLNPFKYAEPPQPHQSTTCSYWEFRKRHIDVSDTMLQYWMLIAGFGCLRCMGGSRKFCHGVACPKNFILVFFTEGSADLASLSKQLDPRVLHLLEVVNNSISKETDITSCDLQGGMQTRCPTPTYMRCLANNLNSVARSVAYLLNMQADRRSHPTYFSWRNVSSPDDSRRPSCQLLV